MGPCRLMHSGSLVCRYVDPQIRSNFSLPNGVELRSAVSQQNLDELYSKADVFVLPSLVRGFGYVVSKRWLAVAFVLERSILGCQMWRPRTLLLIPASNRMLLPKRTRA